MHLLVDVDLSSADIAMFDSYEAVVLDRLSAYGARIEMRVRSVDRQREVHLLFFPDADSLVKFRNDAIRQSVIDRWEKSGATSTSVEVDQVP